MLLKNVIQAGTRGSQPTPGIAYPDAPEGVLYLVTDEGNIMERSNGTTWDTIAGGGSTAGKVYATVTVGASNAVDTNSSHYDYFCDGTDDQIQINSAITAAGSGGRVVLSEGQFEIADSITHTGEVILEGQGTGTVIFLASGASVTMVSIGAVTAATIRNLTLDGNMANNTGTIHGVSINGSAARTLISNCTIKNTVKHNILDAGTHTRIDTCVLDTTKSGQNGRNINGPGDYGSVTNCRLIDGHDGNIGVAGANVSIANNIFLNSYDDLNIILDNGPVAIDGNVFASWGITAIDSNGWPVTINGNSFKQARASTSHTIDLDASPNGCSVTGNQFHVPSGINQTILRVIKKTGNGAAQIVGNSFRCQSSGTQTVYAVDVAASGITISGNQFWGPGSSTVATLACAVNASGLADVVVTGNFFQGWDIGVDISGGMELCSVSNNVMYDFKTYAIDASRSIWASITGNSIEQMASGGTLIQAGNSSGITRHLTITGNTFGLATKCIDLASAQYCTVTGNTMSPKTHASDIPIYLYTVSGSIRSKYNVITGNVLEVSVGSVPYNIREDSTNDGPNIITSNVAIGATTNISIQHASSISSSNLTA